jgi:antitoxin (DNA-binding transcriptional repressor) of toxin-antitoxin stability system
MKRVTIRELHLRTSAIVRAVAKGESYVIEKLGIPVAELRPFERLPPLAGFHEIWSIDRQLLKAAPVLGCWADRS